MDVRRTVPVNVTVTKSDADLIRLVVAVFFEERHDSINDLVSAVVIERRDVCDDCFP